MSTFLVHHRLRFCAVCFAALLVGCSGAESRKIKHMEKGETFLAAGNFEKARLEFRNALQIAPNDSTVRLENGVVAEKLGNRREAAQFYQGAVDANKNNAAARAALGRLYVLAGDPTQALELIKPSMDQRPDDAQLLTVRAAARDELKDLPGALADGERAVQLAPNDENAVAVLAGVYQLDGQQEKGLALLQGAVKRIPASVGLRLALAEQYVRLTQEAPAEAVLIDLIRLEPAKIAHRLRLAQFYTRLNRPDDAERVLREGVRALPGERDLKISLVDFLAARRSSAVAEKELLSFIAQQPNDNQLRFALARFYEHGKDYPKAEAVYTGLIRASGLDGPGITARDRLAELLSAQNDAGGAEKLLGEVLAKDPRDDDALSLHANLALKDRNPKTAIADLRSVLHDQPNATGVMRVLARAHLDNGEPALAEETLRRAVDASPNDAKIRIDLAKLLVDLGKPEQAKAVIDELVEQQPNNLDAQNAQFEIAMGGKDLVKAKSVADAIVASNPKLGIGYYYQGTVAEVSRIPNDAIRLYSASLDREVTTDSLEGLTRLLAQQKRVPEALKRLDDVAARIPTSAVPFNLKGQLLMSEKREPEGIAAFKEAIRREPNTWSGYRNLAYAQVATHDVNTAIATLKDGIGKVTSPVQLDIALGVLYEQNARSDDALRLYDAALRQDPRSDALANNLAMLLVDTKSDPGSLERAKQLAERFSTSDNPELLDTYGWVLYKHGETAGAVTALLTAASKAPNMAVLWYHLGMAQLSSGQKDAALDSLTRSLKSGQAFTGEEEAKATLARLVGKQSGDAAKS